MRTLQILLILVSLALVGLPRASSAQWVLQGGEMNDQILRGIELIYNMEFDRADLTFDSVVREHPQHPAGYFFRASVQFWRAITNPDNTTYDDAYRALLAQAINRADTILSHNEKDVTGIFYKGSALGMRARLLAYRPNLKDVMRLILGDAKEGVHYLNEIEEIIPGNPDVLFGRGLYNFYVEAEKEDNPTLSPIISLFATGNKQVGLQMLEYAAQNALYAKTEAQYELMRIYYIYEKNFVRANALAQYLTNKYPNNVQFLHYLAFSQVVLGQTEQYDSTYHVILARAKEKRPGYTIRQAREAMLYLGQAQLFLPKGNIDSALWYFYNSDVLSRKISSEIDWWVVKAELFMGQAYDLRGSRSQAVEMYRRVLAMKDLNNSHEQATRFLKTPYAR